MGAEPENVDVEAVMPPPLVRCFVIGPIGNKFGAIGSPERESWEDALEVFEKVIVPACSAFEIEPVRADQIAASGAVTDQVLRHIFEDELVIADVSGGNPNVMYELGLRHTRPLLTILLGEYGQLPFDISDIRTIQFSKSERGLIDARKALERSLAAGLSELPEPIPATRIWNSPGSVVALVAPHPEEPDDGDDADDGLDENGIVERLAELEESFPEIAEIATEVTATLTDLGEIAVGATAEIQHADTSTNSAKARLVVISRFAGALQEQADLLTGQTTAFQDRMGAMNEEMVGLLTFLESHREVEGSDDFLTSVEEMARVTRESMENLSGFGTIVNGLGELSRALRRPARQIAEGVTKMASTAAYTDEWASIARRVRQARATPPVSA